MDTTIGVLVNFIASIIITSCIHLNQLSDQQAILKDKSELNKAYQVSPPALAIFETEPGTSYRTITLSAFLKSPLLSAILCPIAFKIAFRLLTRCESLAWANCLAGLMAIKTTAAKIAIMPITTKISIRVKP